MSQRDAARAIEELRDLVLADPELRAVAQKATTLAELEALWKHTGFRQAHDRAVANVTEQDVKDYVEELSDEDLEVVSGGVLIGLSQPASLQGLSPRDVYVAALGGALSKALRT